MSDAVEALLERLLTGELDVDSDEARRLFVEHPEAKDELQRLQRVERSLRSAGDEGRDVLAEAERAAGAPGEDAVAGLVQQHFERQDEGPAPAAPRAGLRRWLVPIAAAAGIVFVIWARPFQYTRVEEPLGPTMGAGLRDLVPRGPVEDYGPVSWSSDAPPHHYFMVFVYDAEAPEGSDPFATSLELDEPRWTPDSDDLATWPRRVRVEVRQYEGQALKDRLSEEIWLSP